MSKTKISYTTKGELTKESKLFVLKHLMEWLYNNQTAGNLYLCWEFETCIDKKDCKKDCNIKHIFPELYKEIQKAIKTTGGYLAIHYKNEYTGKINLLKRVEKQLI